MQNDFEKVLIDLISDLKPAPYTPNEIAEHEYIELDRTEKDNSKWLTYITDALETANTFEIHCWNEETEWIEFALCYGKLKDDG